MAKRRSICRRCHRLRYFDSARPYSGYCDGCTVELRTMERPRQEVATAAQGRAVTSLPSNANK
jgi:hypothetical protein